MESKALKNRPYRTIWTLIDKHVTDPAQLRDIQAILTKLGYIPGDCVGADRIWNSSAWVCPPVTLRAAMKSKLLIPSVGSRVILLNKNNNTIPHSKTTFNNWKIVSPDASPKTVQNITIHLEADFNGTLKSVDFTVPWA